MIVTITGKSGSGKDTVADALARAIGSQSHRLTFSDLLREELDYGIFALRSHRGDATRAIESAAAAMNLSVSDATELHRLIGDLDVTSASRHPSVTAALVKLGSDWRPRGHWPARVVCRCLALEASGRTVILAGNRLPHEHEAFAEHALRVRLDIDDRTQRQRILARDGIELSREFRTSFAETALDDRTDFDLRIDGGRDIEEIIREITALMGEKGRSQ